MDIFNNDSIKSNVYNFFNFIIFVLLYSFVITFQYYFNNSTTYYISLAIDIIFTIFIISFSQILLTNFQTVLSSIILFIIFGFLVTRLIAIILFSDNFQKIEEKRKDKGCKFEDISRKIRESIFYNKMYYLYNTVLILFLLYIILFWNNQINNLNLPFLENNQLIITVIILISITIFSTLHTYEAFNFKKLNERSVVCDKVVTE